MSFTPLFYVGATIGLLGYILAFVALVYGATHVLDISDDTIRHIRLVLAGAVGLMVIGVVIFLWSQPAELQRILVTLIFLSAISILLPLRKKQGD